MKKYVISLKNSTDRRKHIICEMAKNHIEDFEIVDAINGKELSREAIDERFDTLKSYKMYSKNITPSEIGCTLSHQKCYKMIIDSKCENAVIFEDDVLISSDLDEKVEAIKEFINIKEPIVILLSGMYWYFPLHRRINGMLVKVFNAYLTSSYLINQSAAYIMYEEYPWIRADDWRYYMKKGVKIYAFQPHIVTQDWSGRFTSTISAENRFNNFSLRAIYYHCISIIMRILKLIGGYEFDGE